MDRQFNYSYPSTVSLKWKPKEQMTIDFYFMKMNDKYVLCSGVDMNTFKRFGMSLFEGYEAPNTPNADKYFPVQFESYDGTFDNIWKPTDEDKKMLITNDRIYDNFEGLVGEFQLSDEKSILAKPKLLKIRYDRIQDVAKGEYFGNAYRYAELIWHSIKNPLEIKTMCDAKIDSYFASDDNDEYSAQRAFNSFVKTNLIEKYLFSTMGKRSRILDAMAGKGQDLARVIDIGFTEIIAIDKDIDALYEMLERKYNLRVKRKNAEARVNIKQIDLENVPEDFKIDVDCAMINFGIHYLCHDNGLNDFVKLCTNSIKSGGRLLITALDGENVFQLLNTNPLWKLTENGKIKYSIQKKYSSKQFLPLNQTIGVLLPFSNGEMYDEYLVNFEYIETLFTEFKLVAYDNFQSLMKVAKKDNKHLYDKLTETDQKWVSMYSYMILEKK
jgi:SAM-dependent methyltransferase